MSDAARATTSEPSGLRAIFVGTAATSVVVMPLFLTGAMAVQLREDLQFSAFALGITIAAFRGTSALTAPILGPLADSLGARRSLRLAACMAALSSAGIAVTANAWWVLVTWMAVGGCANSLGHPAAHRLLVRAVPSNRQGLGLGMKQSAQPTASMLAGLSVPLIGIPFGWRWGFALGGGLALLVVLLVPRRTGQGTVQRPRMRERTRLKDPVTIGMLALAFFFGNAATTSVPAFYVDSAVTAGSSQQFAGTLLAVASVGALLIRFGSGVLCDSLERGHLQICAGLAIVGASGLLLLGIGRTIPMTIGVVLALGAGWGFNVLLWYPLIRAYREAPGAITGAVAPGGLIGGTLGPIAFGAVVDTAGYPVAWTAAAGIGIVAAGAMFAAAPRLAVLAARPDPDPV